jgi:putative membrane protein
MLRTVSSGILAGVVASIAVAPVNRLLDRCITQDQRRRERRLRRGSPHEIAGPAAARKLLGRALTPAEARGSRLAFSAAYGVGWGVVHALLRSRIPTARSLAGLPFALPFFALCDGAIAPALRLGPSIARLPWQLNAKELASHVLWTAVAETVHRVRSRRPR